MNIIANLSQVVKLLTAEKVIVSIPVIPGVNDSIDEMNNIVKIVVNSGVKKVRLLPYHVLGSAKYEKVGRVYEMQDKTISND